MPRPKKQSRKKPLPNQNRKSPRKVGRPTVLTNNVRRVLVAAIQRGASYEHACNVVGISYRSFRNWIVSAENKLREASIDLDLSLSEILPSNIADDPYVQFFQSVKKAEASGVLINLDRIDKAAASGQWQASAWLLERRHPKEYGRRIQEIHGPEGGPIQTQVVPTDPVLIAREAYKKAREQGMKHEEIIEQLRFLAFSESDLEGLVE